MKKADYLNTALAVLSLISPFIPITFYTNPYMQIFLKNILPFLGIIYLITYWAIVINNRMRKIDLKCRLLKISNGLDMQVHQLRVNFNDKELKILGFTKEEINKIDISNGMFISEIAPNTMKNIFK